MVSRELGQHGQEDSTVGGAELTVRHRVAEILLYWQIHSWDSNPPDDPLPRCPSSSIQPLRPMDGPETNGLTRPGRGHPGW